MTDLEFTSRCLVRQVYAEPHYTVWIVKMPDMDTETYGVVNNETGVIENLQSNIFNAKALCIQFSKWVNGEPDEDMAAMLRGITPNAPAH